jgi:preprotein translocase subunit SecE
VANPEEKDAIEPTSSDPSSTPDDVEATSVADDEAALEPVQDESYELGAEADEDLPDNDGLDEAESYEDESDEDDSAGLATEELTDPEADESNGELVAVGAPTDRSVAKARGSSRVEKKGKATPKQHPSARAGGRTTPVTLVKESVAELRKVVYPTGQQLGNYFVVVLIFVLFIIAIVSLLDLAFGWAILKVFS